VNWRLDYSLSVLNMYAKHESHKLKPMSDETILVQTEEFRVLALTVNRIINIKTSLFSVHLSIKDVNTNMHVYTYHIVKIGLFTY